MMIIRVSPLSSSLMLFCTTFTSERALIRIMDILRGLVHKVIMISNESMWEKINHVGVMEICVVKSALTYICWTF